jgi:hypothetical protein
MRQQQRLGAVVLMVREYFSFRLLIGIRMPVVGMIESLITGGSVVRRAHACQMQSRYGAMDNFYHLLVSRVVTG